MNVTPLVDTRGAGTSQSTQRRLLRRPSLSHVAIALGAILAFVFNFLALQDRSDTVLVAIAQSEVQVGSVLLPEDVRFVPVNADFEGVGSLVSETDWENLAGWVVVRQIPEGGVVASEALAPPSSESGLRSMSVPVGLEHSVGGLVKPGDRVDVITVDGGIPTYVVAGVEVIAVADPSAGGLGQSGSHHLVLSVDADQALQLAAAISAGSIEVVRSTGAAPPRGDEAGR